MVWLRLGGDLAELGGNWLGLGGGLAELVGGWLGRVLAWTEWGMGALLSWTGFGLDLGVGGRSG